MSPKPAFFDDEERDFIQSFEAALDSGAICPSPLEARAKASAEWRALVERPPPARPSRCVCSSETLNG